MKYICIGSKNNYENFREHTSQTIKGVDILVNFNNPIIVKTKLKK